MVFITNSTYQDFRAKVNGLGQVMSAFGRFVVRPILYSTLSPSGPLGVLQRLRVVVQERTGLPVRLRMRVLCGSGEKAVICSSSPWCRPSTRRSPPCCPIP